MIVYLDNAATTKIDQRVLNKMMPYFEEDYANASSIHLMGQKNNLKIEQCKKIVAGIIKADPSRLFFTSSATEANNMIIKGVMRANRSRGNHFIVSAIEHPSVLASARQLTGEGFSFDLLPVDRQGIVKVNELEKMIKPETVLISVMAVNNEIGTIQPIKKIAKIAKKHGVYFHSDAVQAVPYLNIDAEKLGVDFLSLSAHKFYGPQGVGLAYIKKGIKIDPLIIGGGQESGFRAGTYNLAGIVGFTEALKLVYRQRESNLKKIKALRDYFWQEIKKNIPRIRLNGSWAKRIPSNLNIFFEGIEGEAILIDLSIAGVQASTGSACSADNLQVSSVISALGVEPEYMNSNLRFSLGKYNNKKEIDYAIKELKKTVERLRSFSIEIKS